MFRVRLGAILTLAFAGFAAAHPMGNFSVSHYTRFDVRPDRIDLVYALDLAEIPTFELMQSWNMDGAARNAVTARAIGDAGAWLRGLRLTRDGQPVMVRFDHATAVIADGAGGLPVLRITVNASVPGGGGSFEFEDSNYGGRSGWKEIMIVPHEGARVEAASHGSADRSRALSDYPAGEVAAPPQDLRASFHWTPAGGVAAVQPSRKPESPPGQAQQPQLASPQTAPSVPSNSGAGAANGTVVKGDYLSRLLGGREITASMLLIGLCVAFGLGAMHALSPGHGKTIVAAYLVGSRGTMKHALLLGGLVTFTHTASVFALGLGVLFFETQIVPEKVFPVLGAISGLSIVVIGANLLYRRTKALRAGDAGHHHHHDHHHHDHGHVHAHAHGGHTHSHDGHTHVDGHSHQHGVHAHTHEPLGLAAGQREHVHSHDGHTHSHNGPTHEHLEHTHAHDGRVHRHEHVGHTHGGHSHEHLANIEESAVHTHVPAGHVHAHATQAPPSHDGHPPSDTGHTHTRFTHTHDGHTHSHEVVRGQSGHAADAAHHGFTHTHDGHTHSHVPDGPITLGSLIALGVSGGLVPCPSALVLLLTSIALGRVALGLSLLLSFSAGLAVVLMGIGVLVLYAKHLLPERTGLAAPIFRYVPVLSAAVVTVLGVLMTAVALGWIKPGTLIG